MPTVRRIYLYLISAISLVGVTWSVIGLARLILSEGIGRGQITGLATWLAIIIVGLPIFLFHWLMTQRLAAKDVQERQTIIRRIYFYGLMGVGAAPIISNIYRLVDNGLLALLGGTRPNFYPYDLTTGEHVAALLVWGVVWVYLWRQLQLDRRLLPPAQEVPPSVTAAGGDDWGGIRRLYLLILALAGLVMVGWGGIGLLQTLLQVASGILWRSPVANHSAKLLVGGLVWSGHWGLWQRSFFSGDPLEERSVLRKIYLYLSVFVFSVLAISSVTMLLARLIELALGGEPSAEPLLSQLSLPISWLVVGGVFWAYHWQALRQDARQAPEAPRQASVRRIYAYLVAAIGLAALLTGVGGLLSLLIDLLTTPATIGLAYYRGQVALFTALTVAGIPVWLLPWRAVQNLALASPGAGAGETAGAEERRSTVRKIYLYFYLFMAALAIFGSLGWFVFHILTALLGADLPDDFITLVLDALIIGLLAGGVWLYHWAALRRDGQLEQADQARRLSQIRVVVIDGDEGALGQSIIHQLQHELPGLHLQPVGTTVQAATAMAGQSLATAGRETIEQANYIIGSWQALMIPEIASLVAASSALKLVAPLQAQNWLWAGLKHRPVDYHARQAVAGLKQAIEGEEIKPAGELDTGTILVIIAGVFLFLVVAGGLLVGIASVM